MEQGPEEGANGRVKNRYPTPPPSKNTLRTGPRIEQLPRNQCLGNTTHVLIDVKDPPKTPALRQKTGGFGFKSGEIGSNLRGSFPFRRNLLQQSLPGLLILPEP